MRRSPLQIRIATTSVQPLIAAPGVLANDQDVDGDPLYAVDLDAVDGIDLAAEGSFVASTTGASSFGYAACDRPLDTNGDCTGIQSLPLRSTCRSTRGPTLH